MATTTNYGWTTPDDTALVKDGANAIRTLGTSVDTTTKNLNPETTLGDIAYRSSTANVKTRLGIGTTGQVLTVAGGVPTWAASGTPTITSYTPTLTNFTVGNGTMTAKYAQTGKIVTMFFKLDFGSTSTMGSNIGITLPVTAADTFNMAKVFIGDYGVQNYQGNAWNGTTTEIYIEIDKVDSTYNKTASLSSTIPMTWGATDILSFTLTYLAA